jgi:hypothetical protein
MSLLTHERHGAKSPELLHELRSKRRRELAKAALLSPSVHELTEAPFVDVEDTLGQLTTVAAEIIETRGKAPRKVRRDLTRCASRLLELTEQQPDLLDPRAISLVAHASDMSGSRELLETTLDQAQRFDMTSDTNINIKAIETALELDMPFADVMRTLNEASTPTLDAPAHSQEPLDPDYEYLFVHQPSRTINRPPVRPVHPNQVVTPDSVKNETLSLYE